MKHLSTATLAALLLVSPISAAAQGVSMLNPVAPSYKILSFVYEPPKAEGWRELTFSVDSIRLVYAEQLSESQINSRADFTALAMIVDYPEKIKDGFMLTRLSAAQRVEEKGADLVAMSPPQPVPGALPIHQYTLVVKSGEGEYFEHHFVALAPDKSQYLAAKLVTKDKDFRELPYFQSLYESMAALKFPPASGVGAPAVDAKSGNDSGAAGSADVGAAASGASSGSGSASDGASSSSGASSGGGASNSDAAAAPSADQGGSKAAD